MIEVSLRVLTVDDDEVCAKMVGRGLRKAGVTHDVVVARDGREALDLLRGDPAKTGLTRPLIILLDINMPRMTGIEFLDVIRGDEQLQDHLVFMLTTSDEQADKQQAYDRHVAGYIRKCDVGEDFSEAAAMLRRFNALVDLPT